jgi:hypothetical protein
VTTGGVVGTLLQHKLCNLIAAWACEQQIHFFDDLIEPAPFHIRAHYYTVKTPYDDYIARSRWLVILAIAICT